MVSEVPPATSMLRPGLDGAGHVPGRAAPGGAGGATGSPGGLRDRRRPAGTASAVGVAGRQPAGVVAAHVGQVVVRGPATGATRWARPRPAPRRAASRRRTTASRSGRSPVTTTSVQAADQLVGGEHGEGEGGRVPDQQLAEHVDDLAGGLGVARRRRSGRRAGPASRAATALADGVAPSKTSLVRTMRASASWPVVKKPPPSSSWNRAMRASAVLDGPVGPHRPAGELAQPGEAVDQPGIVGGVGQVAGPAAVAANCAATGRPSPSSCSQRNVPDGHRGLGPLPVAGGRGRLGQGRAVHGVPFGEHLVVETAAGSGSARASNRRAGPARPARRPRRGGADRPAEDGAALEVAAFGDPEPVGDRVGEGRRVRRRRRVPGGHGGGDLVRGPHVEAALDPFGVGVLGRVHAARRAR